MNLVALTCRDHSFEAGLLVDAGPQDVAGPWTSVAQGQETQRQAHPRRHWNHETARGAPHTCRQTHICVSSL